MNSAYGYLYARHTDSIIPNPSYPFPHTDSTLTEEKGLDTLT